ncbi:MAG: hypothetical protein IT367_11240 [Candidatus Hydrogenedentes bacterium]|nr:hypothetical protein [Candidatus Hydrogenedentota bacterium]
MFSKRNLGAAAFGLMAFAAGIFFAEFTPRANAQAQSFVLPSIFEEGARLIGPTGSVEIHEVDGGWIRAKSLSALAKPEEELWMYVPALSGAWTLDSKPIDPRKEREKQNNQNRPN